MSKNGEWKAGKDEFQGYMKKGIESIESRLDRHDKKFDLIFTKISENEKVLERMKVKWTVLATFAGGIAAVTLNWIKKLMG